jgi:hypothetical protein
MESMAALGCWSHAIPQDHVETVSTLDLSGKVANYLTAALNTTSLSSVRLQRRRYRHIANNTFIVALFFQVTGTILQVVRLTRSTSQLEPRLISNVQLWQPMADSLLVVPIASVACNRLVLSLRGMYIAPEPLSTIQEFRARSVTGKSHRSGMHAAHHYLPTLSPHK